MKNALRAGIGGGIKSELIENKTEGVASKSKLRLTSRDGRLKVESLKMNVESLTFKDESLELKEALRMAFSSFNAHL